VDDSNGLTAADGVDVDISENWIFNASLWYIDIDTTAELDTADAGWLEVDVEIDPWVFMLGVGTRF
jgi:outer membrane protein